MDWLEHSSRRSSERACLGVFLDSQRCILGPDDLTTSLRLVGR